MNISLANRLTYRIMLVVLVMMAVITSIVYYWVRKTMAYEAEERYTGILLVTKEEIRRVLSDVRTGTLNNVYDIEKDIDNSDAMFSHVERIIRDNPYIHNCALLFVPDLYPEKGRFFVPFATRDSLGNVLSRRIDSVYNYYPNEDWFIEALKKDEGQWSEAYFEDPRVAEREGLQRMLTSFVVPLHDRNGRRVGVISSDVSLEWLRERQLKKDESVNKKFGDDSEVHAYNFIIDRKGVYIIHPDTNRMLNKNIITDSYHTANTDDDRMVAEMVKGKTGSAKVVFDGVPSWIYYRTVKHVDWSIAIVVPETEIYKNGRELNMLILMVTLVGLTIIFFICRYMIRKTTRPLHRFAISANEVAKGNFSYPLPDVPGRDEVGMLHAAFLNMQQSLTTYIEELQETTATKSAYEQEMKIAHGIQMAMVSKTFPVFPERKDIDIHAVLTPARDVGGDLYDFMIRDEKLFFCIGDVSGKGVPAALIMAMVLSMFRSESNRAQRAVDIVSLLNRAGGRSGYFVTMFVGILDLKTGHLDYCNAGHEPPILISSATPLPVIPNLPAGIVEDWNYEAQTADLKLGDGLFLYTDGLSEAMSPANEQFTSERVLKLVKEHADDTAQQLLEHLYAEVLRHADTAEQSDDLTMLAIKTSPKSSEGGSLPMEFHAELGGEDKFAIMSDVNELVQRACSSVGIDRANTQRLRLAVEEVVANVVNYAEATSLTLAADVDNDSLRLILTDDGKPFDPLAAESADLSVSPDERPPGGLGIVFLRRMTDRLDYQRADNRNVLTMWKRIKE